MESKKEIVSNFLHLTSKGKSREAFALYGGEEFKHHNVFFKGDSESIIIAMEDAARMHPEISVDIKRIIEEGDLVSSHSHIKLNDADRGFAMTHIFKFNNNKVVELWDFGQAVPENMVNEYGMF